MFVYVDAVSQINGDDLILLLYATVRTLKPQNIKLPKVNYEDKH